VTDVTDVTVADVPVDVSQLPIEYVICRTLGHSWDDNPAAAVNMQLFSESYGAMTLRCTRCITERFDYLNVEMRVWKRIYHYPRGYKTIKGQGSRPNLRGELVRRSVLIQRRARKRAARSN